MSKTETSPAVTVEHDPSPEGGFRHSDKANIPIEALTDREKKVLGKLNGEPLTVKQLARLCFPGMRSKPGRYEKEDGTRDAGGAAYRCVLNAMRRLVAGGHVERVCKGTYQRIVR